MIQLNQNSQISKDELSNQIQNKKYESLQLKISKLESTYSQCVGVCISETLPLNKKTLSEDSQPLDQHLDTQTKAHFEQIENNIRHYLTNIRSLFQNGESLRLFTQEEINQFYEERIDQLQNQTKLFQDIQKLQLNPQASEFTKREYSVEANLTLKKWYLNHYTSPYPNLIRLRKLIEKTQLSKKKILNWFINARNSFKRKKQKPQKFRLAVAEKYKKLLAQQKQI